MRIYITGPPAIGKTFFSFLLSKITGLPLINFSLQLKKKERAALASNYEVKKAFSQLPAFCIVDGFPRTASQAKLCSDGIIFVITYYDKETIFKNALNRRFCPRCLETYNKRIHKKCPRCHGKLGIRADDDKQILRKRIKNYLKFEKQLLKQQNVFLINLIPKNEQMFLRKVVLLFGFCKK